MTTITPDTAEYEPADPEPPPAKSVSRRSVTWTLLLGWLPLVLRRDEVVSEMVRAA